MSSDFGFNAGQAPLQGPYRHPVEPSTGLIPPTNLRLQPEHSSSTINGEAAGRVAIAFALQSSQLHFNSCKSGKVEVWRLAVSGPFVCRCLISRTMPCFHTPLVEPCMRSCRTRLSEEASRCRTRTTGGPQLEAGVLLRIAHLDGKSVRNSRKSSHLVIDGLSGSWLSVGGKRALL